MLLRKLELYGFKSFADKTELDFGSGVTAIVGPNGSGKSNISDAIRWALGEQSIRTLRGAKAEDIIFSGSTKRRALGAAEVSLVFDNSDNLLPIDFNEVTVTRRVFRSGDSEYYINKAPCRLKDIHDLLADTGLGRDSMSVIGQNKVDEVLNSKPEERRSLFEEAAGITKYKQRKRDALRKMEETGTNLNRVTDLMTEIEGQLEPMAESAVKTRRYNEIHKELVSCQVGLLMHKLTKADKMLESIRLEQENLTDQELAASVRVAEAETAQERLTSELITVDEQINSLDLAIAQYKMEAEQISGKLAVLDERIKQSSRAGERIETDKQRLEQAAKLAADRLSAEQDNLRAKTIQKEELETHLSSLIRQYETTAATLTDIEGKIEAGKEHAFSQLQQITAERNEIRSFERELERLSLRRVQVEKECIHNSEQLNQAKFAQERLCQEQQSLQRGMRLISEAADVLVQKKGSLEHRIQDAITSEKQAGQEVSELSSRLKVLTHMQDDLDGFNRGIKSLLKTAAPWRSQICGAVAQLIHVPDKYVTAVEVALGGALQHIVTRDDETAKLGINFLKTQNLGRATFLPLNTIRPARPRDAESSASKASGSLGFASALVTCEPQYREVVEFLLGRTIIVNDIDTALRVARDHGFAVRLVTLDGQQVNPGGSLTGGSVSRRESSYLSRGNEIDSIKERLSAANKNHEEQKAALRELQTGVRVLEQQILALTNERQENEVRQAEVTVHLEKIGGDVKRFEFAVSTLQGELASHDMEENQIVEQLERIRDKIIVLETEDQEYKDQVSAWQQEQKQLQAMRDQHQVAVTDGRITIAAITQELQGCFAICRQYEQELENVRQQENNLNQQLEQLNAEIKEARLETELLAIKRDDVAALQANSSGERDKVYGKKLELLSLLQVTEHEIKSLRRKHGEMQSRLHEMQLMSAKYQFEANSCSDQLEEHYNLTIEQAEGLKCTLSPDELSRSVKRLEAEVAALGPVNPNAIEEYTRLEERYRFLDKQCQDLLAAKEYLTSIIRDIDNTMSKRFNIAFQAINEKFAEIFARLFGGGHARLHLIEPDSVLETGIEIFVQPPGKKQQNLALLSGGERALTVIALLFAFLAYRPAPFIVVDEVDAALDEANVQRFSEFLRDYSRHTQFIVVTHRKGTMEAAHLMQGVTMEESGISRLVSVKFMDKAV